MSATDYREGSLQAPTRHPVDWKNPDYFNKESLFAELERIFDICHGCRRCVSLCHAFPTLFDLVDESETMEIDGVDREDYFKVVDHCYLCDLCYMTKCPYVPPHEWNVDFPHLMLQAKAFRFKNGGSRFRDRILTATDMVGNIAGIPVVAEVVNATNRNRLFRKLLDKGFGVHQDAIVPRYYSNTLRKRLKHLSGEAVEPATAPQIQGRVALFATCYCNHNGPEAGEDLVAILQHNQVPVTLVDKEKCCGMPKLDLGDLEAVEKAMQFNVPRLARMVDEGWDLTAPVPSCVLMFRQELPLLFPENEDVCKVRDAFHDPFEYLSLLHKAGVLKTDFKHKLGRIAWHVPCHQRVQNIGAKTREILQLVPDTTVETIERCSGHDGTYAVKSETHEISMKICRPVVNKIKQADADYYLSDCPMAATQIQNGMAGDSLAKSPFTLLRYAYGLEE